MNKSVLLLTAAMLFILIIPGAAQDNPMPAWDDLSEGWNTLFPGGDTSCVYGQEYSFHVRPAESDNLLIFFNGGGACWFGQICDVGSPTFVPAADLPANSPDTGTGIFDLDNPENPFADYTMVFVSYCTGDVHLGNRTVTYEIPASTMADAHDVTVHHNGYVNATTVLNWVYENVEAPETVFVTGSSAGAIASPFYAGLVAEHYPDARVVQLGDGAGGYRVSDATAIINEAWGTMSILPDWEEYASAAEDTLNFEQYYIATANRFPDMVMSQYNTANDATQYTFLSILGMTDVSLQELIDANIADIREGGEDPDPFSTYLAGGSLHTILRLPQFYEYDVDGVRVRDWVAALAAGESVADVTCTECDSDPE